MRVRVKKAVIYDERLDGKKCDGIKWNTVQKMDEKEYVLRRQYSHFLVGKRKYEKGLRLTHQDHTVPAHEQHIHFAFGHLHNGNGRRTQ